jgi:hypothetical protein
VLRIAFNNRLGFEPTVKVKAITDPAVALALRVRTCEIMAFSKISIAASIDSTLRAQLLHPLAQAHLIATARLGGAVGRFGRGAAVGKGVGEGVGALCCAINCPASGREEKQASGCCSAIILRFQLVTSGFLLPCRGGPTHCHHFPGGPG